MTPQTPGRANALSSSASGAASNSASKSASGSAYWPFNTWLAGRVAPRLQMDLIPGLACAAHFVLAAPHRPHRIADYLAAGRAMQRFWLTATALGLQLQPEMTPLIFSRYVRDGRVFSGTRGMQQRAATLSREAEQLVGKPVWERAVFMGRIGAGPPAQARSLRRPQAELIIAP